MEVRIVAFLIFAACSLNSLDTRSETFSDASFSIQRNDNISNAQADNEIFSDTILNAELSFGKFVDLDDGLSATWLAGLEYFDYRDWPGFSHLNFNGAVELKKKSGLGPFVPNYGAQLTIEQQSYDQDIRDRLSTELDFFWRKRLSESWDISINLGVIETAADNVVPAGPSGVDTGPMSGMSLPGDVYDLSQRSLSLSSGLVVGDDHFFSLEVSLVSGDVVSSAQPNSAIVSAAFAVVADPAIEDGFFAYRLEADTVTFLVSWEYALSERYSVIFSHKYIDSEVDDWPVDYQAGVTSLGLTVLF